MTTPGGWAERTDIENLLRDSILDLLSSAETDIHIYIIREHVWQELDEDLRSCWRVLQVRDQVSRVLTQLQSQQLAVRPRGSVGYWRRGSGVGPALRPDRPAWDSATKAVTLAGRMLSVARVTLRPCALMR
jgi:hypothetical protein